jgi:hypothetical protein
MASSKRKRNTTTSARANKRQKKAPASSEVLWEAKDILDEKTLAGGKIEYLVDWEDDPTTGEAYPPEWLAADACTEQLIADWKLQKRLAGSVQEAVRRAYSRRGESPVQIPRERPSHRTRTSRVVESSLSAPTSPAVFTTEPVIRKSPRVRIDKCKSPNPNDYEYFSQLPASTSSHPFTSQNLPSSQSSHSRSRRNIVFGIVPDSEEDDEEEEDVVDEAASYVLTTQDISSPTSTPTSTATTVTEQSSSVSDLTGEQPQSLPPANSIPETEPDTVPEHDSIEDSQAAGSQPQSSPLLHSPLRSQQLREISGILETIVSTSQPTAGEQGKQLVIEEEPGLAITENDPPATERAKEATEESALFPELREQHIAIPEQPLGASLGGSEVAQPALQHARPHTQEQLVLVSPSEPELDPEQRPALNAGKAITACEESSNNRFSPAVAQPPQKRPVTTEAELSVPRTPKVAQETSAESSTPLVTTETTGQHTTGQQRLAIETGELNRPLHSVRESSQSASQGVSHGHNGQDLELPNQPLSFGWSTSLQQNAQPVPVDANLSTQDDIAESIYTSVENNKIEAQNHTSPQSRHDSSQESPEPDTLPVTDSSPLPLPTTESLSILGSNTLLRSCTPIYSSPSIMDGSIQQELNELLAKKQKENPCTPKRVLLPSKMFPNAATRSPSTIPDRSPMPQVATSLRAIAVSNSVVEAPAVPKAPAVTTGSAAPEAGLPRLAPLQAVEEATSIEGNSEIASIPVVSASTDDELSEADDASLLEDDLQLQPQEFIVPLPMSGRQANLYREEIKTHQDTLTAFIENFEGFDRVREIDKVLQRLQNIETHVDLIYSASLPSQDTGSSTQLQHQAQWSCDNSIKFRFIGTLLHKLQNRDIHIILVLENDDAQLFDIVETFLKGRFVNFKSPTRGHQADLARVEGNMMVTVLSRSSSPIVRPPNLIICLDGCAGAAEIRKNNWAVNPDQTAVPLLHLVVPQTVGHIMRYLSPTLTGKRRSHTILVTLAQLSSKGEIGRAMLHTPKTNEAADGVINFLTREGLSAEWPLPSIGSIKDVIDFQSQQLQEPAASPPRGSSVAKRALEEETLDPAKRMRLTPQPDEPTSSMNNEITHISDSMPGTAAEHSKLHQQLVEAQHELAKQLALVHEYRKRHSTYEESSRTISKLRKDIERLEEKSETATRTISTLHERIATRDKENQELRADHKALQDMQLASADELIAENTRLRKEVQEKEDITQKALKDKRSMTESFEYLKEQYRNEQDVSRNFKQRIDELSADKIALEKKASPEVRMLAQVHYDRQEKLKQDTEAKCHIENRLLKQKCAALTEEVARLKNGRSFGVGTRAQSSRPGSRAASPMPAHRDRLANLRNG